CPRRTGQCDTADTAECPWLTSSFVSGAASRVARLGRRPQLDASIASPAGLCVRVRYAGTLRRAPPAPHGPGRQLTTTSCGPVRSLEIPVPLEPHGCVPQGLGRGARVVAELAFSPCARKVHPLA